MKSRDEIDRLIRRTVRDHDATGAEIGFYYDSETREPTGPIMIGSKRRVSIKRPPLRHLGIFHTHPKLAPSIHRVCYPSYGDLLSFRDNDVAEAKIYCRPTSEIYTYDFHVPWKEVELDDFALYDRITDATEQAKYEKNRGVDTDQFSVTITE